MTIKHTTITDVINREVAPALGEFVDDFDVEAIAREAFEYVDGAFVQREEIHAELAPCKDQAFFDAYCERHEKKFGEVFAPAIDCW